MSNYIRVDDFNAGLITNADLDDLPHNAVSGLVNLRPVNGKLAKTFGIGAKLSQNALSATPRDILTFLHPNLLNDALAGSVQLAVMVNVSTKVVTIYAWDKNTTAWVTLDTLTDVSFSGTYYHYYGRNGYFQYSNILRILTGKTAKPDATNVAEGIWLGYIDREYFDGAYDPAALFYDYPLTVTAPDISSSGLNVAVDHSFYGSFNPEDDTQYTRFYKLAYIYDGVQESLLSDAVSVNFDANEMVKFTATIDETAHNKRITAMKLYRSESQDTNYQLIHTIDLLRESGKYLTGNSYYGHSAIHLWGCSVTFLPGGTYKIKLEGTDTLKEITNPGSGTFETFVLAPGETPYQQEHWNVGWELYSDGGGWETPVATGSAAGFAGPGMLITDYDIDIGAYTGGVVNHGVNYYTVLENYGRAVRILWGTTTWSLDRAAYTSIIMSITNGLYYPVEVSGVHTYHFFDVGLPDQTAHPLEGEKSVSINSEFSLVVGSRLWKANLIVDPADKAEEHDELCAYSELGQVDVMPAGNVIPLEDREGGSCTGIAEVFGNPVFLKKHALITVYSRNNPSDPSAWRVFASAHNIGNFAKRGYITVGDVLYVCHKDGIYGVTPNNLAESDSTPTKTLKISGPIEDAYLALTDNQKAAITVAYDQNLGEIMWTLGNTNYCYNVEKGKWRTVTTATALTLIDYDENGDAMVYNDTDKKVYRIGAAESVTCSMTTPTFRISDVRKEVVRDLWIKYKSTVAITVSAYLDDSSTPETTTYTLAAATTPTVKRVRLALRCKRLKLNFAGATSTGITDIYSYTIEHEGEGG